MPLQKIKEEEIPMEINVDTKEITVYLPQYAGVLFTLETNKRNEETMFNNVWEIYGDSIKETLIDYGYELQ